MHPTRAEALKHWAPAVAAALIGLAAALVAVLQPPGKPTPARAVMADLDDGIASDTARIVADQLWGEGRLLLVCFDDAAERRFLSLAFTIDKGRGWRVAGSRTNEVDLTDVAVGALLVGSSDGGPGQPPWSAVYGKVGDDRIVSVEVEWEDGERTGQQLTPERAYLLVREDAHRAVSVRYLDGEGTEIALVPVTV